jgi:hypothetical protein
MKIMVNIGTKELQTAIALYLAQELGKVVDKEKIRFYCFGDELTDLTANYDPDYRVEPPW